MKKITLLFSMLFVLALSSQVKAQVQDYSKALGIRLGYPFSVTFKTFINDAAAIEAYAGFAGYTGYGYFNLGAMYQYHRAIEGVDGLAWFYGGGASLQFWSYDSGYDGGSLIIGINGVLGLDYKFPDAPINLSVDWTPTFFIGNTYSEFNSFSAGYGALSARYVLK
jgi:hypothetical protein